MKKFLFLSLVLLLLVSSCGQHEHISKVRANEYFLVANRGSASISIFNAKNNEHIEDIILPDTDAQPTYLAYSNKKNSFYVGDFINQKVLVYSSQNFKLKKEITIESGAFHLWLNDKASQLWVNNIVSKTTSVINTNNNKVIATLSLPTDYIALSENAVQHDVALSTNGDFAYITVLDGPTQSHVVQYRTSDFSYIRHVTLGGDTHLLPEGNRLYVASQNGNAITILEQNNLSEITNIPVDGPHGVAVNEDYFFTAALPNSAIGVVDLSTNTVVNTVATDYAIPHNLAINRQGNKLFLSHSGGTSTKVVFYDVEGSDLIKTGEFDSGFNPFGVLYFKSKGNNGNGHGHHNGVMY